MRFGLGECDDSFRGDPLPVDRDLVATGLLGGIQRTVGPRGQRGRVLATSELGNTCRDGDVAHRLVATAFDLATRNRPANPVGHFACFDCRGIGKQQRKLLPAIAGRDVLALREL